MNPSNPLPENDAPASTMVFTDPAPTTTDSKIDPQKALNAPVSNSMPKPPPLPPQKNHLKQLITPYRIVIAIMSVCLVASFALNFYQHARNKAMEDAAVQTTKLLITVQDNLTNAENDRDYYKKEYNDQLIVTDDMENQLTNVQRKLNWYYDNIALVNNFYGNCAYHRIGCSHLDDTFYIFTIKQAKLKGCYPCQDCE